MLVVGIHNTGIISTAAFVADGKLVYGAAEERLSRRKHSKYFPHRVIEAGLKFLHATHADVDVYAIGWNPALNIAERTRAGFSEWPAYPGERFYSNPNQILPLLGLDGLVATEQSFLGADGGKANFTYVDHHLSHCVNAYLLSGFDEAAILSCDGYGEKASTVWAIGRGGGIEKIRRLDFPHSLGCFYSAITELLGFRPDHDEWKVMGAAAFGDPEPYRKAMGRLLLDAEDGSYRLDLNLFDHFNFDSKGMLSSSALELLGERRGKNEELTQRHYDIAAAAQKRLEEVLRRTLVRFREQTGLANLCLTGGVAMNSVFNGKAAIDGPFDKIYVPFAPDDSGNSIGAALWCAQRHGETIDLGDRPVSPFLGSEYGDEEIRETLDRYRLAYESVDDPAQVTAEMLAEGKIVGWFQGRMEFGQRALGGRSILADPRDAATKDKINAAVKFREAFRPFAPALAAEAVAEWFEAPASTRAPYMEMVFPIRASRRNDIAAVVHADGTGRLQTVERRTQPLFRAVIDSFAERTGIPVVLNTSFNLSGEPIVESPSDAVRVFMTSGMDALVIGRQVLAK